MSGISNFALGVGFAPLALGCASALLALPAAAESDSQSGTGASSNHASWAFEPPVRPAVPVVGTADCVRNPIDRFILARLESARLAPSTSPSADRITLLRRVTFDLIGLPPTPAEVIAFLQDTSHRAFEKAVERLLSDPRYGERWAQHWLDVVRYADSDGFEYDDPRPHAWRYRDWVIRSFNEDKPYDQFIREQIAGDELFPGNMHALAATGLHRLGPLRLNAGMQDEEKNRQEVLTEITDTLGSSLLGITVGCARCHDHKFDAFSQADYFGLQAFFAGTFAADVPLVPANVQAEFEQGMKAWDERVAAIEKQIKDLRQAGRDRLVAQAAGSLRVTDEEVEASFSEEEKQRHAELSGELLRQEANKPTPVPSVMAVLDNQPISPRTYILRRGEPGDKLREVGPNFPRAIQVAGHATTTLAASSSEHPIKSAGRRTALANWLSSPDHPLTARVMVNRIWQHHFGRAIVATPNDFGEMGVPPSHPQLLDWLATEFIAGGWSIKQMHRLMVTSATYRQSSQRNQPGVKIDPENRFLWRMNRQRLEAEILRDSVLSVAGTLNVKAGGPGVRLPLAKEVALLQYKGSWRPDADPYEHARRSIYVFLKRNLRPPLFECFDAPSTMMSCGARTESSHAGQALELMNGSLMNEHAWSFARRLLREAGNQPSAIVERAYRLALARPARDQEHQIALAFLDQQVQTLKEEAGSGYPPEVKVELPSDVDPYFAAALADFCLVMFNLDEFLFVD